MTEALTLNPRLTRSSQRSALTAHGQGARTTQDGASSGPAVSLASG
jgi:hypothetical protein